MKTKATSSGGYGSSKNVYSDSAQRGKEATRTGDASERSQDTGLVTQSTSGGNLSNEVQDAKQGVDWDTRREVNQSGGPKDGIGAGDDAAVTGEVAYAENLDDDQGRLGAPTRFIK
jgi:hypothetical protein